MRISYLLKRSESEADAHDSFLRNLLEVLLCGLGAAAALMIIYSVLPKSGRASVLGALEPERAATRAELRARRPRVIPGHSLTQVWVEAGPGSGLAPIDILLHAPDGLPVQRWTEGSNETGWRCVFLLRRRAEDMPKLEVVCQAHTAQRIVTGAKLHLRVGVDTDIYHVDAVFHPEVMKSQVPAAGSFLLTSGMNTLPLPPLPPPHPIVPRDAEVPIITIHPANADVPLRGKTPF